MGFSTEALIAYQKDFGSSKFPDQSFLFSELLSQYIFTFYAHMQLLFIHVYASWNQRGRDRFF